MYKQPALKLLKQTDHMACMAMPGRHADKPVHRQQKLLLCQLGMKPRTSTELSFPRTHHCTPQASHT